MYYFDLILLVKLFYLFNRLLSLFNKCCDCDPVFAVDKFAYFAILIYCFVL